MTRNYRHICNGVCPSYIDIVYDDDTSIVNSITFSGGCDGNHKGLNAMISGLTFDEIINRLTGIKCGFKNSSCPDQIAKALVSLKTK